MKLRGPYRQRYWYDALTFMAGDTVRTLKKRTRAVFWVCITTAPLDRYYCSTGRDDGIYGIPNFAPELFRRIRLKRSLKQKRLLKGLVQLSEEGQFRYSVPSQQRSDCRRRGRFAV